MGALMQLPDEVLRLIVQNCDQHSRTVLSAATHRLHRVCIEEIYHTVDLSVHNSTDLPHVGPVHTIAWLDSRLELPLDFSDRPRVPLDDEIWTRQKLLIRTIKAHPEYGQHVRQLNWSVLDPPHGRRTNNTSSEDDEPDQPTSSESFPESGAGESLRLLFDNIGDDGILWDTFLAFKKVTSIDIAWLRDLRETCPPPPLFTTATCVRLVGQASRLFVSAILDHINPENLVSLSTINLQQFADPIPLTPSHMTLREITSHVHRHMTGVDGATSASLDSTYPGPMQNHLVTLTGRCPRLAHLEIRTYAPWERQELLSPDDDRRYAEWAAFLRSVRPSLRTFVFEQHRAESLRFRRANRPHPFGARGRPVLWSLFGAHILPVLLEDKAWPRLERVELAGFHEVTRCFACVNPPDFTQWEGPHLSYEVLDAGSGGTNDMWAVRETHVALNEEERRGLKERLGEGVELTIRGASRRFENSCKGGIPGFLARMRRGG
ncbi:uncharacterized protein BKCO1_2400030 [Diplodia corticola]|uniref:F-box domain-containing protein n=1 Tax=Diplodia corticola TaxID=236234 RepID=A0A1J9S3K8_9PEZI|nr:uncharacterized protein BKCO1_2400030 [Diplodia corticola]OJD34213.1 hypothetical protein BKCO1_2400030 [Diplodia corticola]